MKYTYNVAITHGVYFKTYVAKITGKDPTFHFKRCFLYRISTFSYGRRWYTYELGGHGVFEQSIKRYSKATDILLHRERKWFVYYRKAFYEINYDEVLFCVFNLNAQYRKKLSFQR